MEENDVAPIVRQGAPWAYVWVLLVFAAAVLVVGDRYIVELQQQLEECKANGRTIAEAYIKSEQQGDHAAAQLGRCRGRFAGFAL